MLQQNQHTDLQIFYYLTKRKYAVQRLASLLKITPRKLRQRVALINEILATTQGITDTIQITDIGIVKLNAKLKPHGLLIFYRFKLDLLSRDYEFRILSMLISRAKTTPAQLSTALFVSKSYLYRLIKTINTNLAPLHITINITNNTVTLCGDEIMVRILAFMINTDAYQSLDWPYADFTQQEILASLPREMETPLEHMSLTKRTFTSHLYAILATRLAGGHHIKLRNDAHLRELFDLLMTTYDVSANIDPEHFASMTPKEAYAERLYFNFLSRIYLSDFYTEANKIRVGSLLRSSDTYFANLALRLTDELKCALHLQLAPEIENILVYFITIGLAYYHLLNGQTGKLNAYTFNIDNTHTIAPSPQTKQIAAVLQSFIRDNHLTQLASADAEFIATNFITTVLAITVSPKVHVYLQSVRDYTAYTLLATMISRVFNEANVEITTDVSQADLVITDSFESAHPNSDVYFFDDIQQNWSGILQAINERILKKLFAVPTETALVSFATA